MSENGATKPLQAYEKNFNFRIEKSWKESYQLKTNEIVWLGLQ